MDNIASPQILIVDDDRDILQVMQIRLRLMGYRVVACIDSQEALSVFEQGNFSLVLTDQCMEGLKGSDLIRKIHLRDPHVSIIIMTAYGTVKDAVESVRQGAYSYLEKPVDTQELGLHIKSALKKRAMEQRLAQERLKGVFEMAGSVAHELSQPMQSILGLGELLKNRVSENDPNFKILRSICQEIEKLGDLITKISNVTRYVTRNYPGNSNIIDLNKASTDKK
ncbi:MAG: response regulator [Thermodesulfobacteriota bacterium]|nr:response regulator [Thermodesulfobacteriota bacterium]